MPPLQAYIVEDSPVIRDDLIATLQELAGLQVVGTAEDEAAAIAWLALPHRQVDIVIVDLFLKYGSGLGVLRARAAQWPGVNCHVVVLSNFATADMRRHCLSLGADRVFDKSHEIDSLVAYCSQRADPPGTLPSTVASAPCR